MGYRSQVASVIEFDTKEHAESYLYTLNEDEWVFYEQQGRFLTLEADWIKWYEDYPEIAELERFYRHADTADGFREKAFVRIGESNDDIEEDYSNNGYELVMFHRSVAIGQLNQEA